MFGSFLYVVLGHLGLQIVRYAQNDVAHGVAWHYGDWLAQYASQIPAFAGMRGVGMVWAPACAGDSGLARG